MIISAAVRLKDGRVFVGKRHGDVYSSYKEIFHLKDPFDGDHKAALEGSEQGFLTDTLQFMNREEAYWEAKKCRQFLDPAKTIRINEGILREDIANCFVPPLDAESMHPCLFSEDLY